MSRGLWLCYLLMHTVKLFLPTLQATVFAVVTTQQQVSSPKGVLTLCVI